ncbi:MAG: methyltransferase domain-containing protein [Chthoniobacterales bacterium]|nr:methyltransferase domain-containing protein [Chthoniobacterales bacterium]
MSAGHIQARVDKHGLDAADYNRSRLEPSFDDPAYVALADLRMALDLVRSDEAVRVLDYGAGGSPYRPLFPKADYRRADCVELPGLDYIFGADEKISESDEVFDLVLSTQVLEHVRHPQLYLREAWRLLKPGGRIIVSTHGLFEEHGAPIDFRRWTLEGLFCELEEAGFRRGRGWKLTCGPRALLFWAMRHGGTGKPTMKSFFGAGWNAVRAVATGNLSWLNRQADRHFGKFAVMEDGAQTPPIYVGVLAVGHKETRT